jgi:hypothetical protein
MIEDGIFPENDLADLAEYAQRLIEEELHAARISGSYPRQDVFGGGIEYERFIELLDKLAHEKPELDEILWWNIAFNGLSIKRVVLGFVERFFYSVREMVCTNEGAKSAKAVDLSAKGVATALASSLVSSLGVSSPIAIGVVAVSLIVIGTAAKSAFCQMTKSEIVSAFDKQDWRE